MCAARVLQRLLTARTKRVSYDAIVTSDMRAWKAGWNLDSARVVEFGSISLASKLSDELSIWSVFVHVTKYNLAYYAMIRG